MDQTERLAWLIRALVSEDERYRGLGVPADPDEAFRLYRSLVNVRPPRPANERYLAVEDAYLQQRTHDRGVVDANGLFGDPGLAPGESGPLDVRMALWRGDITTLRADAIVNAANSELIGCFVPCHGCIDNAIHTAAGVRLRLACADIVARRGGTPEPTGGVQVTPGFNLPAAHVLHTVGPVVEGGRPTARDRCLLASCYESALELAARRGLRTVAFCCISTGVFGYPPRDAAQVAVATVREFLANHESMGVIFDVFSGSDYAIYQELLGRAGASQA